MSRCGTGADEAAGAATIHSSMPSAAPEEWRQSAATEYQRKRSGPGPKGRQEKGGRAKAMDFKARAQAGVMLRLSRVMKNR